jgi:hypothetical protein
LTDTCGATKIRFRGSTQPPINPHCERDAFTIALGRTKAIAAALDFDAEHVEMGIREWLFTASIPDVPNFLILIGGKCMHEIQNGKISHGLKSNMQAWD